MVQDFRPEDKTRLDGRQIPSFIKPEVPTKWSQIPLDCPEPFYSPNLHFYL
jgi:hypothetical protein